MHSLFYRGTQENVPDLPSLADGLTGEVEPGSLTIPMVRECVDEMMLVSEDEIAGAMAYAWQAHGQKVEGSGAVGLAAAISGRITARPLVIIVSGGNVGEEIFGGILSGCTGKTL